MGKAPFFLMLALIAALSSLGTWLCYWPIKAVLKDG
jgi:hypothetical protein